uniref:Ig-like domain-containing protein n=1 Tax=Neolamprologus brichardi TaxID=32507 RepID=A0A3Q4HRK8_NEOBR
LSLSLSPHFFVLTGVWSEIKLEQSPSEVKRPGERVKLSCIISGYSLTGYNIHWVRQSAVGRREERRRVKRFRRQQEKKKGRRGGERRYFKCRDYDW